MSCVLEPLAPLGGEEPCVQKCKNVSKGKQEQAAAEQGSRQGKQASRAGHGAHMTEV